jgi:stage V sporulation protein R
MNKVLEERVAILEKQADDLGVDYYPLVYEIVGQETMLEVMSYGLPTRARHWSYGQSYEYQKMQGEMGFSKVYEVVLNNDPSYAFLLDTNSDTINTMIIAHVIGHSCVFKTNHLFKQTDNKMVYHAAERAQRIEGYIDAYGLQAVERLMDIGFALDKHIDWHKGIFRKPYENTSRFFKDIKKDEFSDILDPGGLSKKSVKPNKKFPPNPEFDLLWFILTYSRVLEPWQVDVLDIIRKESYYFYAQYMTKILNEGMASLIHADLMHSTDCISHAEHLDFCKVHEKVVQPGGNKLNINPYFLGFSILNDVKNRWNKLNEDGESEIDGMQKVFEIVRDEDDISFIRNYLTKELAEELKLFTYVGMKMASGDEAIHVLGTELDMIKDSLTKDLHNYRSPLICITEIDDGVLQLEHRSGDIGTLDHKHLAMTLEYMYEVWGEPINISTVDADGKRIHYTFDELGFSG